MDNDGDEGGDKEHGFVSSGLDGGVPDDELSEFGTSSNES